MRFIITVMEDDNQAPQEQPQNTASTNLQPLAPPNNTPNEPVSPLAQPKLPDPPASAGPQVFGSQDVFMPPTTYNNQDSANLPPNSPNTETKPTFAFGSPSQPASANIKVEKVRSKKRIFMVLMLVILVIGVLSSGSAFAYYSYVNNKPEKVLADALSNTMKDVLDRKPSSVMGSVKYEFKENGTSATIILDYDSKMSGDNTQHEATLNVKYDKIDASIKGAVISIGENEVYVKFDNIKKTIEQISGSQPEYAMIAEIYLPIIEKIDGNWIKMDKASLVELGYAQSEEEVDKCSSAIKNLRIAKADQKKLKELFLTNQFLVASEKLPKESVESESSYHYKIDFDEEKSIQFTKSVIELESFKTIKADCKIKPEEFDKQIEDLKKNTQDTSKQIKPIIELWVGGKTRRPTKLKITTNEQTLTVDLVATIKIYSKTVNIEAPKESINFKELKKEIETIMGTPTNGDVMTESEDT